MLSVQVIYSTNGTGIKDLILQELVVQKHYSIR